MDKTFNDLMDIVNRTKKIDESEGRISRPRKIIKTEPEHEDLIDSDLESNAQKLIKPKKDLDPSESPLFAGKNAITKFLNSKKREIEEKELKEKKEKQTKKSSAKTSKSSSTKKTTKKKSTKKSNSSKSSKQKSDSQRLKEKVAKISNIDDEKKKEAPVLDMKDPKNIELYNALKETLFADGTDVSDYMETDELNEQANKLKEISLSKKRQSDKSEELSQEQKEYEMLFTGSFMDSMKNNQENEQSTESSNEQNQEMQNKDANESDNSSIKKSRFDTDLEEIKSRDEEINQKIADYYKRKQEKINKYNSEQEDADNHESEKLNDYESKQQEYADIFSGEITSRDNLDTGNQKNIDEKSIKKENEVQQQTQEDSFQKLYRELNSDDFDENSSINYVTPNVEKGEIIPEIKKTEPIEKVASEENDSVIDTDIESKNDQQHEYTNLEGNHTTKQTFEDDELVDNEINEIEDVDSEEKDDEVINPYDLSDDDADLDDYIVSSNVPVDETDDADDSVMILNANDLPESHIDVLGNEIKSQPKEKEQDNDTISKTEFYNEMARLQENLINELKGEKKTDNYYSKSVQSDQDSIQAQNEDLQNINQENIDLTSQSIDDEQKAENVAMSIIEDLQKDEKLENIIDGEESANIQDNNEQRQDENVDFIHENNSTISNYASESLSSDDEKFKDINLLNKDVALNEQDLEFIVNSEKPKDKKDDYFYLSEQDKENKAEDLNTQKNEINSKEVGDINLNLNVGNAIPTIKQIENDENQEDEKLNKEKDIEAIYTLFGMERKKIEKDDPEIKVLYVTSECQPFIATGGLGDVAGSLPKMIAKSNDVDIRVIMPLYSSIKAEYRDKFEYLGNFTVHLSWRQEYCGLFKFVQNGVTYYFVDNERYFKREKPYGYYDDGERFGYFCKAVVESLPMLNFFPEIIHCNDWQTALVSTFIKTGNWQDFRYYKIKNIYTIHNVEYQGVYGMENLKDLFGIDSRFKNDVEYNGDINLTKAAIQYSDLFTTVSESYCDNLKQPYCSRGLHHIIIRNEYKLRGIINGIDYDFYNPKTDNIIYKNYDIDSISDKVMNKKLWQDELGLPVDANTPMIAVVSRLVSHKGIDLLTKILEDVLQKDIQLVVVGTGDQRYVDYFKYLESKYPSKVRAMVDKYSLEFARKAYSASDIFVMPSKIEPCGISQMIASRYGSIPLVREVGGLRDTIKDFGCEGGGNGYTFASYNPNDLLNQLNRALNDYKNQDEWRKKMKKIMSIDFSWDKSAGKYIDLYKSLLD